MSARERVPRGSVSGPTHGSAPTDSIETSLNPGRSGRGQSPAPTGLSWCAAAGRRTEGMASADQISFRNLVGGHRHRPLRGEGKAPSATLASGAEHLRQRSQGVGGTCGRDHPKVSSNLGQSLNRGIAATAPFAQGSLWPAGDEKAGGHIGPPLRGHRSAQQRQAGRDRARPLQKDGEYAEGWGDERTQGRFDIYRAVIGLVSRKAECPE